MKGRPPKPLPVTEIMARYKSGVNTGTLALDYGVCRGTIWNRLRVAGVKMQRCRFPTGNQASVGTRSRPKPGGPLCDNGNGYLRTRDRRGRHCYVHRACWEAHHGPTPHGHDLHHINSNRTDNCIENLECLPHSEHMHKHMTSVLVKED